MLQLVRRRGCLGSNSSKQHMTIAAMPYVGDGRKKQLNEGL